MTPRSPARGRSPSRAPRLYLLAAVLAILLASAGCRPADGEAAPATDDRIAVRTADVAPSRFVLPIEATGTVAARDESPLGFAIGGVVAQVLVREGMPVRRGQLLATLDLREVDARLRMARSGAAKAKRDLARVHALYADSVATRQQLDDALTAAEIAAAEVDAAEFARRYATVVANADGVVLRRSAEPGQVLAPGTVVLTVGDRTAGTVLRVGVSDRDVVRVRRGDRAVVRVDAYPGREIAGRVAEIAAAATAVTGTYQLEVRLENALDLPQGMVGRVTILPASAVEAHLVPTAAIIEADGDRASVYVVRSAADDAGATGDVARRVSVRLGGVREGTVAVLQGLEGTVRVVTDGASFLHDGSAVRVLP